MLVTVLQLSQMVVGVYINIYSMWIKRNMIWMFYYSLIFILKNMNLDKSHTLHLTLYERKSLHISTYNILYIHVLLSKLNFFLVCCTLAGHGMDCVRRNEVIQLALTMYGSYFVLFANFFYNSYLKSSSSSLLRKKAV